jgi:hypothetical protein
MDLAWDHDPVAVAACIDRWATVDPVPYALIELVARRDGAWRGVLRCGGKPLAALARAAGRPALLASPHPPTAAAAAQIAVRIAEHGGINGPVAWAEAVSAAIARPIRDRMGLRLHRLQGPPRLPHPVSGHAIDGVGGERLGIDLALSRRGSCGQDRS